MFILIASLIIYFFCDVPFWKAVLVSLFLSLLVGF
jgi:hypothetical protein